LVTLDCSVWYGSTIVAVAIAVAGFGFFESSWSSFSLHDVVLTNSCAVGSTDVDVDVDVDGDLDGDSSISILSAVN